MVQPLDKTLSGVAGEYFVAAELSRRGYIASITLRNTQSIDIIASDGQGRRAVSIQVKTNQGNDKQWILNKKAETMEAKNLFYVFVVLHGVAGTPEYHIVDSRIVAKHCRDSHRQWLMLPKRDGTPRKDTPMRTFSDKENRFLNAWDRLGLGLQSDNKRSENTPR